MRINTATDSSWSNTLKVTFIVYGSEGKTREIQLMQQEPEKEYQFYLPGNEDTFFVSRPNILEPN